MEKTETANQRAEMKSLIVREWESLKADEENYDHTDRVENVFDTICPVGYKEAQLKEDFGMDSDEILDFIMEVLEAN